MGFKYANFWQSTLQQAVDANDTTLYIVAADQANLPTLGVGDVARCVIYDNVTGEPEIVDVTAHAAGALTVVRARENTAGVAWPSGAIITQDLTAAIVEDFASAGVVQEFTGSAAGTDSIDLTITGTLPAPTDGDVAYFITDGPNSTENVEITFDNGVSTTGPHDILMPDGSAPEIGAIGDEWLVRLQYSSALSAWVIVSAASRRVEAEAVNGGPIGQINEELNGDFSAWNAGTTITDPADAATLADGYYIEYDGTTGSLSVSRQSHTVGQSDVAGGPKHYLRLAQTVAGVGDSYRRIRTRLDKGVQRFAGKKVVRSVWMKADTARNVTARIIQFFGTGGSPSASVTVVSETWALTTAWQRFDISATMPSVLGKTLGSDGNDAIILSLDLPVNTTMTIEMSQAKFEPGDTPSEFGSEWPLSTRKGGLGGSYASLTAIAAAISLTAGTWLTQAAFDAANPDVAAYEALSTTGIVARTGAGTVATRSIAVPTGMGITNADGVSGNPTLTLGTALADYVADPMSSAELASITAPFGTAAFVPDNTLVHLAGTETITGDKTFSGTTAFSGAVNANIAVFGNTTNTDQMRIRFPTASTFEFVPAPATVADVTKGFGYDFTNSRWYSDTALLVPAGAVGAPGLAIGAATQGIYSTGANLAFSVASTLLGFFQASALQLQVPLYASNGSVGAPAVCSSADTNTGLRFDGSDGLYLVTGGADRLSISSTAVTYASGVDPVINSATAPGSVTSLGFRGVPNIAGDKSGNYTHALTDAGAYVGFTTAATFTIDTNANKPSPIGTTITIESLNGGGNVTIHPETGVTLRRGDGTAGTGDRTVAANSAVTIRKRGTNEWYIYGPFT